MPHELRSEIGSDVATFGCNWWQRRDHRRGLDDHRFGFEPHAEALFDARYDALREREQLGAGRRAVVDEDECMLARNAGITFA